MVGGEAMDITALEQIVERDVKEGARPVLLVGRVGGSGAD